MLKLHLEARNLKLHFEARMPKLLERKKPCKRPSWTRQEQRMLWCIPVSAGVLHRNLKEPRKLLWRLFELTQGRAQLPSQWSQAVLRAKLLML